VQRRQDRIKKFQEQTRWIPNSSFNTFYGKSVFENYGRGNVNPANGGFLYGNYLYSHNVNPHRGDNLPTYQQSYNTALAFGERMPVQTPEPPRKTKEDFKLSQVCLSTQSL